MKLSALIFATVLAASSPQYTTPIVTTSEGAAPVALSGIVKVAQPESGQQRYSYEASIVGKNVSDKDILLQIISLEVNMDGNGDRTLTRTDDYFFRPDVFRSDATENWHEFLPPLHLAETAPQVQEGPPNATCKIVFVQFADGSTWGDSKVAADTLRERRLSMEKLQHLAETFYTEGEQPFLSELMMPSQLTVIGGLQTLYRSSKEGTALVLSRLAAMVSNAERHSHGIRQLGVGRVQ